MYHFVLFDFDGTLIDTNQLIIDALNATGREFLGRNLSEEEIHSVYGRYLADQMKMLSEPNYEAMMAFYRDYYHAHQDEMVKPFHGIPELLKSLKKEGIKTAIVSAKGRTGIMHGLELYQLTDLFDVIISAYDAENNKPHPEPALKALEKLHATPSEALMVGDSPYDILCGQNAGIHTILVDWTIFPKEQIYSTNPTYIAKTPEEILEICKK